MLQFPHAFEFTLTYLQYIVQCFYSGYFLTFRGNNERDRLLMSRRSAVYEETAMDDLDYANMSMYLMLLLRGSTTAMLMINPNYQPPKANEKQANLDLFIFILSMWSDLSLSLSLSLSLIRCNTFVPVAIPVI
jgi:hypothetical protein